MVQGAHEKLDISSPRLASGHVHAIFTLYQPPRDELSSGNEMQTLQAGYRGFALLVSLNLDRILYVATIGGALLIGAWVGSHLS